MRQWCFQALRYLLISCGNYNWIRTEHWMEVNTYLFQFQPHDTICSFHISTMIYVLYPMQSEQNIIDVRSNVIKAAIRLDCPQLIELHSCNYTLASMHGESQTFNKRWAIPFGHKVDTINILWPRLCHCIHRNEPNNEITVLGAKYSWQGHCQMRITTRWIHLELDIAFLRVSRDPISWRTGWRYRSMVNREGLENQYSGGISCDNSMWILE